MVQATAVAAALPGWAAAKEVVGQAYAAENTFDIYQRIAMQRSRTQPPKPADKPGGSWVLTSFRPSGCAPPPANASPIQRMQDVCRRYEPEYEWKFVRAGEAIRVMGF